jgi:hypothetical protein
MKPLTLIAALLLGSAASAFDGVPVPFTYPAKKVPTERIQAAPAKPTPMPPDNMPVIGMDRCACPVKMASANAKIVDAVPLHPYRNGRAVRLEVFLVAGEPLLMLLDTGATLSQIPTALADRLVAAGRATVTHDAVKVLLANGSTYTTRVVTIDTIMIGNHVVHGFMANVTTGGDTILAFPVVDSIGSFTIDTRAGQLVFHP